MHKIKFTKWCTTERLWAGWLHTQLACSNNASENKLINTFFSYYSILLFPQWSVWDHVVNDCFSERFMPSLPRALLSPPLPRVPQSVRLNNWVWIAVQVCSRSFFCWNVLKPLFSGQMLGRVPQNVNKTQRKLQSHCRDCWDVMQRII